MSLSIAWFDLNVALCRNRNKPTVLISSALIIYRKTSQRIPRNSAAGCGPQFVQRFQSLPYLAHHVVLLVRFQMVLSGEVFLETLESLLCAATDGLLLAGNVHHLKLPCTEWEYFGRDVHWAWCCLKPAGNVSSIPFDTKTDTTVALEGQQARLGSTLKCETTQDTTAYHTTWRMTWQTVMYARHDAWYNWLQCYMASDMTNAKRHHTRYDRPQCILEHGMTSSNATQHTARQTTMRLGAWHDKIHCDRTDYNVSWPNRLMSGIIRPVFDVTQNIITWYLPVWKIFQDWVYCRTFFELRCFRLGC